MQPKKILFWGHIGNVHQPMEEMHHLSPVRSQAQAEAFADMGYDVTQAVFYQYAAGPVSPNLQRKYIFDLKPEDYDIFFLNFRLAINQLYGYANGLEHRHARMFKGHHSKFQNLLDHPYKVIQLDAPRSFVTDKNDDKEKSLVASMKHIGISTENGMKAWGKMTKTQSHFLCHAATISFRPPKARDPLPITGRPRVLYLGRLNDASVVSSVHKIEELAKRLPHIDFIVVSCKIKDKYTGKILTPMMTDPEEVTKKKVIEARKQFEAPNIYYMPGPRYSDTFNYMYHADLGIGFAVRHGQDACSCKVYEYLGSGCPVVLEDAVPEAWILNETECGLAAKTHDFDDFAAKIEEALAKKYNRTAIKNYTLAHHTYQQRVIQYHERFES